MKVAQKAKQKWFKKHVAQFAIIWQDNVKNASIFSYSYPSDITYNRNPEDLYTDEIYNFAADIAFMKPYEIFFKYRRKFVHYIAVREPFKPRFLFIEFVLP